MGDRRMAEIVTDDGSLYVYSHWGGCELPAEAEKAVVAAQGRWNDRSYATRILVDQLTKPGRDEKLGYGLLLRPEAEDSYNNDKPSVIIDLLTQTLTVIEKGRTYSQDFRDVSPIPAAG